MSYQLTFSALHLYDAGESGITVPAVLRLGLQEVRLEAKVDTGSSYCIFQRGYGENLGLDVESGHRQIIGTAVGSFAVYGHPVTLSVKDFDFDIVAYFAADYGFTRNVLGRYGFLNRLRIGLVDYEGKLYLGRGDEGDAEG
jgi:voltage-gated potassium channel Kch